MSKFLRSLVHNRFKEALEDAEQEIYLAAYNHAGCNEVKTAELLGVSRGTLRSRLKQWNITKTAKVKP